MLHGKNLTPHRAIWVLAVVSAVIGCFAVSIAFGDAGAPADAAIKALPQGFWSSFGYTTHDGMAALPNSLLTITLASNFGTFLLYGLSCIICIVAFHRHPKFNALKHLFIPLFGLAANLACMAFYLIGPFMGYGTKMEPLLALGIALIWAISLLITPYVNRLFDKLAQRAPRGSFLEDALLELSDRYSTTLIRSFGEAVGELVFGAR